MGGRKVDYDKDEVKRKKEIDLEVDSLLLNNNCLRNITGMSDILRYVLPHGDPSRL